MREKNEFIKMMQQSYNNYCQYSSRSNKKVNVIHGWIRQKLNETLDLNKYEVFEEKNIPALNASGRKKADIVVFNKHTQTYDLVFSVKFICSNYKQNKNNYLENLIGECRTIKLCNPEIKIVPFNIFPSECPYFRKDKTLKHTEKIDFEKDLSIYSKHSCPDIYDDVITYLIDIDYDLKLVTSLNDNTPYVTMSNILSNINFFNTGSTNIKPPISSF